MSNIDFGQQRESNDSYESYGESNGEGYEKYGKSSLPGENTTKRENGNADDAVYDRYDYDRAATPDQEANIRSIKSCCKKGRLFHSEMTSAYQELNFSETLRRGIHFDPLLNVKEVRGGPTVDPVKYVTEVSHVELMQADSLLIHPISSSKLMIT